MLFLLQITFHNNIPYSNFRNDGVFNRPISIDPFVERQHTTNNLTRLISTMYDTLSGFFGIHHIKRRVGILSNKNIHVCTISARPVHLKGRLPTRLLTSLHYRQISTNNRPINSGIISSNCVPLRGRKQSTRPTHNGEGGIVGGNFSIPHIFYTNTIIRWLRLMTIGFQRGANTKFRGQFVTTFRRYEGLFLGVILAINGLHSIRLRILAIIPSITLSTKLCRVFMTFVRDIRGFFYIVIIRDGIRRFTFFRITNVQLLPSLCLTMCVFLYKSMFQFHPTIYRRRLGTTATQG